MKRFSPVASAVLTLTAVCASPTSAQRTVSPDVQSFVRVDDQVVTLVGVSIIDGTGAPARANQTLVLRDGRIAAMGPSTEITAPNGARVLELSGHTIMPGYVMVHEHLFYGVGERAYPQQEFSFPKLYLAGGATTIRTGGSRDPYGDLKLKEEIDAGRLPGPRIHVTGPYVNGRGLPILFVNSVDGPDDARNLVRYWSEEGATSFKAYQQISKDELAAAIEEAHARGLKVTGHLCSVTYREAADLGIDNLEHGFRAATDFVREKRPDECPDDAARTRSRVELDVAGAEAQALIAHLVDRGVALTSTLTVAEANLPARPTVPPAALDVMAPKIREAYLRTWATIQEPTDTTGLALLAKEMAFQKAFSAAGGLLVAGTDPTNGHGAVIAGFANQRMVELLHEAGFTPEESIKIASLNGAILLGVDDQLGTVEPGKLGDLIVLEGDPTTDITSVRNVVLVFKDGLGYDPDQLIEAARGSVGLR